MAGEAEWRGQSGGEVTQSEAMVVVDEADLTDCWLVGSGLPVQQPGQLLVQPGGQTCCWLAGQPAMGC